LFPFGHDGAGDEIAVRAKPNGEDELIFVDHEARRTRVHGSLRQWMNDVVAEAVTHAGDEADEKFWCVQFTFECPDETMIFAAMETVAPVRRPDTDWLKRATSPSGVRTAKFAFIFLTQARLLTRSTAEGWSNPHFSFDYEEPVSTPENQSTIRRLDAVFRSRPELNYQLVDYGPMEWPPYDRDDEEPAPAQAVTKPWWTFW
jgi:hypothetical protein